MFRKIVNNIIQPIIKQELKPIIDRLTIVENQVSNLDNKKQLEDMSKAIKGLYDLLCGVINIGGKK